MSNPQRHSLQSLADRYRAELIKDVQESSRLSKFRPIGMNLSSSSPSFKPLFGSLSNGIGVKHEHQENTIPKDNDAMDYLFADYELLQQQMMEKLNDLNTIHNSLEVILNDAEESLHTSDLQREKERVGELRKGNSMNGYNPLPTPNDDFDEYDEFTKDDEYDSLPSSPGSFGSDNSQLEIELNDKLSRLAQLENDNKNVVKLKNIVHSSIDLMKFELNGVKLVNTNSELGHRSQVLKDRVTSLIDSFT